MGEKGQNLSRSPVLAFHKISPRLTFGSINFPPKRFRSLLISLIEKGYTFVPLESLPAQEADSDQVAISFDDAYQHLLTWLPPLIEEFGIAPTVFVPTEFIGAENTWDYSHVFLAEKHLSASEMRSLAQQGVRFGSHGHSHVPLTGCTVNRLHVELAQSKARIEDIVGHEVTALSYPFGRTDPRVTTIAAELGYEAGYTMRFPCANDVPLSQGRFGVWGFDTPMSVRRKLTPGGWHEVERIKASITNGLSGGTDLWQRFQIGLRGRLGS